MSRKKSGTGKRMSRKKIGTGKRVNTFPIHDRSLGLWAESMVQRTVLPSRKKGDNGKRMG
jgi:hypothetical protein